MADPASHGNDQGLLALKKGTQLVKYSRKGKPKLCPFRLSPDEKTLIWYSHGSKRSLNLSTVSKILPGQRTPVFKRFFRPEKEYLSFSLIYNNGERSLDLICKDKVEAEVWIAGLTSLISTGQAHHRHSHSEISDASTYGFELFHGGGGGFIQNDRPFGATLEYTSRLSVESSLSDSSSRDSDVVLERANMQVRSGGDGFRISVSSTPSCLSGPDDIESLGDVFVWGEIWSDGASKDGYGNPVTVKGDVLTPKPLESNVVLDVQQIACGARHVALVTRQGEVFTWGEESGGRLGHGVEKDFSHPRLVEFLAVINVDFVACGEHHTCAVSASGDLYTWGDGAHNVGLLGHGNDVSHWIPKRVSGVLEDLQVVSVACGTWHSGFTTSTGRLFTVGEGTFGALGHGNRESITFPKEVHTLDGLKSIKVACGVWHTAAIVEVCNQSGASVASRKLFTWGDGDKNRLGHGNKNTYLLPTCVSSLIEYNMHQVACGHNFTVALTMSGHVFTMGSNAYGQLGNPDSDGKQPCLVQDRLVGEFVEDISCGDFHVAALTSRCEVFTWGRGANGRLGHGDTEDRNSPTLVEAFKDKHVKNIACGSNYTASICIHKWVSGADQSVCTGCRQAFGFTRKRHNCYNCGLVHCHACSSKKALKAALAPTPGKPHRVCDPCYLKLKKAAEGQPQGQHSTASASASSSSSNYFKKVSLPMRLLERGEAKPSRILLSPKVEPIKYLEVKSNQPGTRTDSYNIVRASQVPSLLQLKDIAFPSSLSVLQSAWKPVMTPPTQQPLLAIPPPSFPNSRSTSPYSSRRPSPPRSPAPGSSRGVVESLKKTNELLNQEVTKLQNQIKSIKQKSEHQDMEIRKMKKNVQDTSSLAADRSSKCNTAIEIVKSISFQLKEMTEKLPSDISERETIFSLNAQVESFLNTVEPQGSEDSSSLPPDRISSGSESPHNIDGTPQENNGVSHSIAEGGGRPSRVPSMGRREIIEQFEPGIYVTLIQLSTGSKIFKRVRFSKRRFDSQQAEEWWRENKDRLLTKYSPKVHSSSTPVESPTTPSTEETTETETA
nr:PH, RCC1 and FYVE domains-containing protein 1 [Ipomoea batatas]